ncbi:MAG: dethiobiotin synthase, partial [Myxococcota bacterium]
MSLFVIGTDTGVGKTLACAVILARHRTLRRLVYWKPVATGALVERDRDAIAALVPGVETAAEAYLFGEPVSPHLAARQEGGEIEMARISARWRELRTAFDGCGFVVEGAGGLLVPLDEHGTLLADLVAAIALPVLLVARSTLGTINHTLLTLEAARSAGLHVAGVVITPWPERPSAMEEDNRATIGALGHVEVAVLPRMPRADPA